MRMTREEKNEYYKRWRKTESGKASQKATNDKRLEYRKTWLNRQYKDDPEFREKMKERSKLKNFSKYGLSKPEYDALLDKQSHCCAICQISVSQLKSRLEIDHNHQTGKVRGLLCGNCNKGIGMLQDKAEILQRAIYYLKGAQLNS